LGHVFLSLEDNTVVNYLCTEPFNPTSEHGINPLDPALAIPFGKMLVKSEFTISTKDLEAPTLAEALDAGILPT
jgi:dTDP-4-dehydrorhamnose 3,5-epimerase